MRVNVFCEYACVFHDELEGHTLIPPYQLFVLPAFSDLLRFQTPPHLIFLSFDSDELYFTFSRAACRDLRRFAETFKRYLSQSMNGRVCISAVTEMIPADW